jgi:hypothetical protein
VSCDWSHVIETDPSMRYFSLIINDVIIDMNKFEFLSDEMFEEWKHLEWVHGWGAWWG